MINAQKFYSWLFVVTVLLQLYLPSFKANILLQLLLLGAISFMENHSFSKNFLRMLMPFIILFLLGFIGLPFNKFHLFNIIKDVFHFLKPITGLLLGYMIFRRINDYHVFIKTVVTAAIISSIMHLYVVFVVVGIGSDLEQIREFTRDNFLDLFALIFLIFYKRFSGARLIKNNTYHYMALGLIIISCVLYFSRTMIIMAGVLVFSIYGFTRVTPRNSKYLIGATALFVLSFIVLLNVPIRRGAPGVEGFLYKVKNSPSEIFKTKINREDHRDLWDHWRGYEAHRAYELMVEKPYSFITGTGHGSLVNLKFPAPLTGADEKGMRYISELHNGYMYVFYKTGIIGLFIYLSILFKWYKYIYKNRGFNNAVISAIGFIYIFSTLIITGIYNSRDIIVFILGACLYFADKEIIKPTPYAPE